MKKKRYDIYDFLKLNLKEQEKIVVKKGRFLHFKNFNGRVYSLFALDLFFVEIRYEISGVEKITPFRSGYLLDRHCNINLEL